MNDNLTPGSRVAAFHEKHSATGDSLFVDGWHYYPNGAMRERDSMGLLAEPDKREHVRDKVVVFYYQEKLRRAADNFVEFKNRLLSMGKGPHGCDYAREIEKLEELKEVVSVCKKELADAEKRYEDSTPEEEIRRRKHVAENALNNERFVGKVSNIRI